MIALLFFCSAMDVLANCRAMLPAEPVVLTGEIVLRNRKGIPSGEYDYTLRADRTATPAKLALEFREHDTTNVLEKIEILRPGPVPEGRVLKTDVTWLDLTLDFLWWPKAEYEAAREGETVHGQKCDVILISNGSRQVRAWCDKKTGCLMQAEELDAEGKAFGTDGAVTLPIENSWSYTKLGHIENITGEELASLFGDGNITVTLSY